MAKIRQNEGERNGVLISLGKKAGGWRNFTDALRVFEIGQIYFLFPMNYARIPKSPYAMAHNE